MISTFGSPPSLFTLAAASQIARTCIAYSPGFTMPSRTPRRPSIGFISCSSFTFCSTRFCSDDVLAALLAERDLHGQLHLVRQELVQRRVQQPHRDRQPAHRAEDADEVLALQREQDVVRGLLLLGSVSAKIICCTARTRSSPRNMCSVRHRPMPSAPRSRAFVD